MWFTASCQECPVNLGCLPFQSHNHKCRNITVEPTAKFLQRFLWVGLSVTPFSDVARLQLHCRPDRWQWATTGLEVHLWKQLLTASSRLIVDSFIPTWTNRQSSESFSVTVRPVVISCLHFIFWTLRMYFHMPLLFHFFVSSHFVHFSYSQNKSSFPICHCQQCLWQHNSIALWLMKCYIDVEVQWATCISGTSHYSVTIWLSHRIEFSVQTGYYFVLFWWFWVLLPDFLLLVCCFYRDKMNYIIHLIRCTVLYERY